LMGIASAIAILLLMRRCSVAFLVVVMWAILGIAIAHPAYAAIQVGVIVLHVALAAALIIWAIARGHSTACRVSLQYRKHPFMMCSSG